MTAVGANSIFKQRGRHCERSEAIHLTAKRKNGLLRRFAPRNDRENIKSHSRDADRARVVVRTTLERQEGAGNAGCPMHPQPRVRFVVGVCTRVFTAEAPDTSGIPHAMVLTAYFALSPVTSSFLPPSPPGLNGAFDTRLGRHVSTRLDISNGCQDHTPLPYASAPFVCAMCHRSRAFTRPAMQPFA